MIARSCFGSLVTIAALSLSSLAMANAPDDGCDVTLQQLGSAHVSPYNALRGGEYSAPIRLRLHNKGDRDCSGTVSIRNAFGDTALKRVGGGELNYSIVDEHNRSMVVFDPETNTSEDLLVSIPSKKFVELQPRFIVPGGQQGRGGRYAAILEARFRETGSVNDAFGDISLHVEVTPTAQANFVGYGRHATMDLGELSTGSSGSIGLQIRASDDVNVQVTSAARGNLLHDRGAMIPYTLTVDGQQVELTSGGQRQLDLSDSIRGKTIPISVLVGRVERAPVGEYRDVVTFRISAQ